MPKLASRGILDAGCYVGMGVRSRVDSHIGAMSAGCAGTAEVFASNLKLALSPARHRRALDRTAGPGRWGC